MGYLDIPGAERCRQGCKRSWRKHYSGVTAETQHLLLDCTPRDERVQESVGEDLLPFSFSSENSSSGQPSRVVPKAIFLEQEHGVDVCCASPINSSDGTDNNWDEESQFPAGTLNANRGHLCWEEWKIWKAEANRHQGERLAPVTSHRWRWAFLRLLMVKERTLEEKMNLLEDVRLLNLEDRGEVWRRRLEWCERKITQREFWTDWIREERKWVCNSLKYHDPGEGSVVMAMTMISESMSITWNYP